MKSLMKLYYASIGFSRIFKINFSISVFLGGLGIHKFYLNDTSAGILYLCFSWTGIPEIVGILEGIIYLTTSDEEFHERYVKYI